MTNYELKKAKMINLINNLLTPSELSFTATNANKNCQILIRSHYVYRRIDKYMKKVMEAKFK